ncbi:DUF2891 family protein [Propioniciclava soli]|uniref:DUF2891 family protein n=1 Tax=Propioniciclava soli TaxID=2775081 RepID=UPI001E2B7835
MTASPELAARAPAWAETGVTAVRTTYPWASQHVVTSAEDVDASPQRLNPAFHGSFDWHSCVHMLAAGVTLLDVAPDALAAPTRTALVALLDERLDPARTAVEAELVRRRPGFERPYGWAWVARLAQVCAESGHPHAERWSAALEPVADAVFAHLGPWMTTLDHPVRTGAHDNTAFSLGLLRDAAGALGRPDVVAAIDGFVRRHFVPDTDYPVAWEPGGHDFLSAALCEATLVARVLPAAEFADWLAAFLPGLGSAEDPLLGVPHPTDPSDGKAAHLLGLALSRAWHLRTLTRLLPDGALPPERAARLRSAANTQAAAVADHVVGQNFMATHWLVSYALGAELAR